MANNWPDGGERQLSRGEKLVMGCVAVALIATVLTGLLLIALRLLGPVSWVSGAAAGAIGLAVGLLWIRPWETEPPTRRRTRTD